MFRNLPHEYVSVEHLEKAATRGSMSCSLRIVLSFCCHSWKYVLITEDSVVILSLPFLAFKMPDMSIERSSWSFKVMHSFSLKLFLQLLQ